MKFVGLHLIILLLIKTPLFAGKFIPSNQWLNITGQLEYGVRGFMLDLYYKDDDPKNTIILAHRLKPKPAFWNRRYFKQDFSTPFLSTIKQWLHDNPQDIITIHLESYVCDYKKIIDELDATDKNSESEANEPSLKSYLFDLCEYNGGKSQQGKTGCFWPSNKKTIKWPTLGEMRKSKKRLVIFSDKAEDAGYGITHVSNTMETQYDLSEFPVCEKRSEGRIQNTPVFVMNHFYKYMAIPGANLVLNYSAKANKYGKLLLRSGACCLQENKCPNFIAIDDVGLDGSGDRQIVLTINKQNFMCHCVEEDYLSEEKSESQINDNIPKHDEL